MSRERAGTPRLDARTSFVDDAGEGMKCMRYRIALLCLVAAISGTLFRQAEAAADLARTVAELADAGSAEEPDGGVGDEPESALPRGGATWAGAVVHPEEGPALGDLIMSALPGSTGTALTPIWRANPCVDRLPDRGSRRQAQLGPFLF
jgi:hypothetical protein